MALEHLRARYNELCAERDRVNALVAPKLAERERLNLQAQEIQQRANAISLEVSAIRGGQKWLDLKKEIAALADVLRGRG